MQPANSSHAPARLKLTPSHGELPRLEAWLHEFFLTTRELPARTRFGLELVLTEAVTNIMDLSRKVTADRPGEAASEIELTCALHDGYVSAELIDDGPPFDPTASAPVVLPASLDEASPGGLGIHLMRRYTSSMEYVREQNKNVLRMTVPVRPETRVS